MTAPQSTGSGTKTFYPVALLLRGAEGWGVGLPFSSSSNMLIPPASANASWASAKEKRGEGYGTLLKLFSKNKITILYFTDLNLVTKSSCKACWGMLPDKYKDYVYPENERWT